MTRSEGLDNDIAGGDQLPEQLTPGFLVKIKSYGPLAGIGLQER